MTQPPKRPQYAEVTIAALTGEISGEHLYDPTSGYASGYTSRIWPLEKALANLAEGGYVIDLRPLASHPRLRAWVFAAPISNGRIEDEQIEQYPEELRRTAEQMLPGLGGEFQQLAFLIAHKIGEPTDGSAGPMDRVSAAYRANYWGSLGARIGKRVGNTIYWSTENNRPSLTQKPRRGPIHHEHSFLSPIYTGRVVVVGFCRRVAKQASRIPSDSQSHRAPV